MTLLLSGFDGFTCWKCGCVSYVPHNMFQSATQANRGDQEIFCPNGHGNVWRKGGSDADELRRERDRLKQEAARLQEQADRAELERASAVRALASHKKRVSAGTCPCCKRTFSALANHMKRQHPTFVAEQGAKVIPIKAGAA